MSLSAKAPILSMGILAAALLAACSPAKQDAAPTSSAPNDTTSSSNTKHLAVTAILEHPSLDSVRKGMLEQLKTEGFEEGKNLTVDFQSAQGNPATAAQIAKKFAGDKPDVVVAISTPSAQAMVSATKEIPIVYSAVTDPISAKLVSNWKPSGTNVTGASDGIPLGPQIDLMKKLVPNLKSVGYVYSPGEVNSTIVMNELKADLGKQGINLSAASAQRSSEVLTAARSLNGKAQLIYTSLDNNVVSSYESMYKAANEIKVPLVASNTESVERGAVAALGISYADLGKETGKIVARILKGEKPGDIPSQRIEKFDLYLSPKHAASQGIDLPNSLKAQAAKIIE
ncbi:MAG: ABC transporter substrate-binding protein [Neisseria sp.]|uniref:ABC transporter substrate-binding protein n=1 Tax=Neisseria sp. TaxID=192066 RepID=UPI0026DBC39A|nr:ABC transporter substrate-binding protein [Neisseria sp.]MDO4640324.1 ABC transporter substrate-binding protein [Neisseria sp.]